MIQLCQVHLNQVHLNWSKKEKEVADLIEYLWMQHESSISEEEALSRLFRNNPCSLYIVRSLYDWLKEALPFRCGVRLGKDRISFLIGNYRPAAINKERGKVRLEMGFVNN